MLEKFSDAVRGNLTKLERLKLVALITIEVGDSDHPGDSVAARPSLSPPNKRGEGGSSS